MKVISDHPVIYNDKEWVAVIDEVQYGRDRLLAKIKAMVKRGLLVEEEWAALALIERRTTEDRWRAKATDRDFYHNLPTYTR
jgi:hypothetical protein